MPRVDVPEYKTFVDFPDGTPPEEMQTALATQFPKKHGIVDTLKGAGARVAQGVNSSLGSALSAFGADAGAEAYKQGADYWDRIAKEAGSSGIPAQIYEGLGGAPMGVAEFVAGVPYAGLKGGIEGFRKDGLTGAAQGAGLEALKRFAVGKVFKGIEGANLSPVGRSATMAGTMGAQTAAEGGTLQDVIAATATGAALMPPTGGGAQSVVRSRLQRAGATPEVAADLSGRFNPDVQPAGMGDINVNNVDTIYPSGPAVPPAIRDSEQIALTGNESRPQPATGGAVLDAENASRISPYDATGPSPGLSIEVARLKQEHPYWSDAEYLKEAVKTVQTHNPEVLPAATDMSTVRPATPEPIRQSEDAPSLAHPLPIGSQEMGQRFGTSDRLVEPTAPGMLLNPEVLPARTDSTVVRSAEPQAERPGEQAPSRTVEAQSMENFNHGSLPDAAVTAADSLALQNVAPRLKVAVVGTPAEVAALDLTGKTVMQHDGKAYVIDPAAAKEKYGSVLEAKRAIKAGGDSESEALGYPARPAGEPLQTAAVTKTGEVLTDPAEIKQAATAGEVAYAAEGAPAELAAKIEPVAEALRPESDLSTAQVASSPFPDNNFSFAIVKDGKVVHSGGEPMREYRGPNSDTRMLEMAKKFGGDLYISDKPIVTSELKTGDIMGYTFEQINQMQQGGRKNLQQDRTTTVDMTGSKKIDIPEIAPAGQKGGDVSGKEKGRGQEVLDQPDPTLLHAGVHLPTLIKQVRAKIDHYTRKLDRDAPAGSPKAFLDANRDANAKRGTEPLVRWLRRAGIDQSANAQNELMSIGAPGEWARREFDAISGSSAKAGLVKERFREEAMSGMSLRERQAMSDMVAIDRDLAIAASGKTGYTHIGGFTPTELAAARKTFQADYKLSDAEMARTEAATARYFKEWQNLTGRLLDAGLIDAAQKTALDAHGYSPKQFLDKIDPFTTRYGSGGKVSVPDSGIQRLKSGSDSYFRNDPVALLEEGIDRVETRIARNDANRALADLPAGNGITEPAQRVGKDAFADPPAGYEQISYMKDGRREALNVREDFAREWAQADPLANSMLVDAVGWISGASAVRAGSTGHNPLFALANMPVDAVTIWLQADKRGYSSFAPKALGEMAVNLTKVAKDAWKHEGRYEDWVNDKGAREMLSNYGGITSRRAHLSPLLQKVSDVTSKIGRFSEEVSRLAYREQLIKNGVPSAEASKIAGEYVDFSRGGSIIKAIDRLGLPYLNAGVQGARSVARAAGRDPGGMAVKMAQLLVGASALYGANQLINPEGWANVSDREKADNFIVMLPSYFSYVDKDGTTTQPYIRIKKEQSVRPFLSMAEAGWQMAHESKDATQQVKQAFDGAIPVSASSLLPPVAKMYLAYAGNLDTYRQQPVWRGKQEIAPFSEYTNRTNPILTDIGKATATTGKDGQLEGGVSPERLGAAVGQVIVPSNLFVKLGGYGATELYDKMNPRDKVEFSKNNYEKLVELAKGSRLFGEAKDTEQFREGVRESRTATNTQQFEVNKALDAMVLRYVKGGKTDPELYDRIVAHVDKQKGEARGRLENRISDLVETVDLPDRGWWMSVKALQPEDRADQFKARLAKVSPEEQSRMINIANTLKGFSSERFMERYNAAP